MLELRDIRAGDIDQRRIRLDDAMRDERSHADEVVLHTQALEGPLGEDQRREVFLNGLQQRLGGRMMEISSADTLIASVAINPHIVSETSSTSGAEGLDGEHIAFLHALTGAGLDKGDLLVTMDLVPQDVMPTKVPDCFDGDGLAVELDFVALHDLLDGPTDVIDPGINASFLCEHFSMSSTLCALSPTFSPVLVAALTAASRLS